MNGHMINAMMDSGAGCSIIDLGSLERIGMQTCVERRNTVLINASGNEMNIVGIVKIPMAISHVKSIVHEFKVLDTKTYANILMLMLNRCLIIRILCLNQMLYIIWQL